MKNATFRQLRVFNEVARHLSFARAAEVLHLTPPAVTMQVKELEGHVGLPLFERSGRQISVARDEDEIDPSVQVGPHRALYRAGFIRRDDDAGDRSAEGLHFGR